jgi:hypothetical protein
VKSSAPSEPAASVAVLAVTGWLGGELAFRDRIGMTSR